LNAQSDSHYSTPDEHRTISDRIVMPKGAVDDQAGNTHGTNLVMTWSCILCLHYIFMNQKDFREGKVKKKARGEYRRQFVSTYVLGRYALRSMSSRVRSTFMKKRSRVEHCGECRYDLSRLYPSILALSMLMSRKDQTTFMKKGQRIALVESAVEDRNRFSLSCHLLSALTSSRD